MLLDSPFGMARIVSPDNIMFSVRNASLASDIKNVYIAWVQEDKQSGTTDIVFTKRMIEE